MQWQTKMDVRNGQKERLLEAETVFRMDTGIQLEQSAHWLAWTLLDAIGLQSQTEPELIVVLRLKQTGLTLSSNACEMRSKVETNGETSPTP